MHHYRYCFMEHNDVQEAARVLSVAMLNNPLHIAVFQGEGETERLKIEQMFLQLFMELPGIVFVAKTNRKIVGVMRMKSAVGTMTNAGSIEIDDENDIDQRRAFWLREWAIRQPAEQCWLLGPIGVLPSHRKKGVGSELMERFCNEVDKCAANAYLETDLDENVRFYKKFGFEVIAESDIFNVKNRYMMRK